MLRELPAYIQAWTQFAGDWLFPAPPAWNCLSDVKTFKKKTGEVGIEILDFWDAHCKEGFEEWGKIVQKIFMLALSNTVVERVFSFLHDTFDGVSQGAIIDGIRTAMKLLANGRII